MGFLFFANFTRSFILMKFDQKVVHSLFTGCIPCLMRTLTLSSNHALYSLSSRRLSSKFILYTRCTPCSLSFSVGHCTRSMWCIPHYRRLSSCFLYVGCILCSLYFCWSLSSDHVVYSMLQRDILLFEFVRAVYN